LLFCFGYVPSRAQYDYFGVDVDTVGAHIPRCEVVPNLGSIYVWEGMEQPE
jgi:hypothetical protein